uniref:Uncharacterized protein n=1 Tax=Utricularia reniformis TaxID=192314 RepID=A0A1Y0B1Z8_9LAMI|nr:hypothetical protein AEK19_MT1269 [Utricularia reniformis]ART31475.1 hypothetical protein AEK19_MT1269 [Utricularia reniformis]
MFKEILAMALRQSKTYPFPARLFKSYLLPMPETMPSHDSKGTRLKRLVFHNE